MAEPGAPAEGQRPEPPTGESRGETRHRPPSDAEWLAEVVEREDRSETRQRLLSTIKIGLGAWVGAGIVHGLLTEWRDLWWVYAVVGVVPILIAVGVVLHLRRDGDVSWRLLRFYEVSLFTLVIVAASIVLVLQDGWGSIRVPGAGLVLMTHGLMMSQSWRRSLVPVGAMTAALPVTFGVCSLLVPDIAAELADPAVRRHFGVQFAFVLGAAIVSVAGGHTVHSLRKRVAEARSVGRYQLRERIGSGGMGEVWAAYHAGLQRDVAVKLIQPQLGRNELATERFAREVRTLAELTHPNTVRVFDYGTTRTGVWYYAMELLSGEDLESLLEREGRLEPSRALRLLTQVAQALGEAHEHGVVHRDVKPANVFLVRPGATDEYVKLIDFGIAKSADDQPRLTEPGHVIGTPGFMAPEVITGSPATPRSDVYSLGVVFYVTLSGTMPFPQQGPASLVRSAFEDPPRLSERCPDAPDYLDAIVTKCMARDPAERFATAREMANELRKRRA